MTQHSSAPGFQGPQRTQVLVGVWLTEDQWNVVVCHYPKTKWALRATDGDGRTVVVGQPEDARDSLIIQGDVVLDEQTKSLVRQTNDAELDSLLWNLRRELIQSDVEFRISGEPLALIQVSQRIFFGHGNELSKDIFFQRVSRVRRGILLVRWLLERCFSR